MSRKPKTQKPPAPGSSQAEREAEKNRLRAMGATLNLDRGGRVVSARLSNVFMLLYARKTITLDHHDAAYRLAQEWATWRGLDGKPERLGASSGSAELVTDRMIRAGREVHRALDALDAPASAILTAFMVATVEEDRAMAWRGIMERLGYTVRDRQTEAVVDAVEQLRRYYHEPRKRAAA